MNKVTIISRQADKPSLDIKLLSEELTRRRMNHVVLTKTLNKSIWGMISYIVHMIKQVYHIRTSNVVIVDGYCIPVSVLPKKNEQTVIQMWHALGAVKKFGWQSIDKKDGRSGKSARLMKMHRNYDYFFAPGEHIGRAFAKGFDTSFSKCVYMGLPRIDYLRTDSTELRQRILEDYPIISDKINVLYIPTFRRNRALEMGALVNGFDFERFNLIIKKHPLDDGDYAWAAAKGAIVDDKYDSIEWLKICNKIITDYSAMLFEGAIIRKELYVYQPDVSGYEEDLGLNINLRDEAIGEYVCYTEEVLFDKLWEPYDLKKVDRFCAKYIEAETEDCTRRICGFIETLKRNEKSFEGMTEGAE